MNPPQRRGHKKHSACRGVLHTPWGNGGAAIVLTKKLCWKGIKNSDVGAGLKPAVFGFPCQPPTSAHGPHAFLDRLGAGSLPTRDRRPCPVDLRYGLKTNLAADRAIFLYGIH